MIVKRIIYFDHPTVLICDGRCSKAWGINERPKIMLSNDEDDYEFLSDDELGEAPREVDTWEGGDTKPQRREERMNKWCARACERSTIVKDNEDFKILDFNTRVRNIPLERDEMKK